jgi:hypothetical protein
MAGWSVTVAYQRLDQPGTLCGGVEIEGLRYRVHHGPRVRRQVNIVPPGQHLIAAAVKQSMGQTVEGIRTVCEFGYAARLEPDLTEAGSP